MAEDFWFWVITLAVAVVGGGRLAFRAMHTARLIEDTPTSRVRSAAQGYVELSGRVRALQGAATAAPLTGRPCVWWRFRIQQKVERRTKSGRRESWRTINSGRSEQPFLLDDGTGECIVQPSGAEMLISESTTWYGDAPWPPREQQGQAPRARGREYRYHEDRIYEHEQVYVLGQFSTVGGARAGNLEAEAAALLSGWKRDQAALVERFDQDGDGRVSLEEWERAHELARQIALERRSERPVEAALHTVGKPADGRLFMIAAFPEGDVAKRYRRKAVVAFTGFAIGVYALAWLLQQAVG